MPMPLRPLILFESPVAEVALRRQGLATLDAIFAGQASAEVRHVGRAVLKTELPGLGRATETGYIKLSWGRRRWWPRMSDIRTGQVLQSLAVREWEGLKTFERLGLQVPERLALLEEGALWKRSALILRAVPPPASLSDMILDGSWLRLPREDRGRILDEVARTLAQIHDAGWAWRSISTRHVFPQRDARGDWKIWLIDCEGVHRARSAAILQRDLRRFLRALCHDHADEQTLETMRDIGYRLALRTTHRGGERTNLDRSAA
jgi:Lipopolysaccharide kinase (Kdo/WaaP) family